MELIELYKIEVTKWFRVKYTNVYTLVYLEMSTSFFSKKKKTDTTI